jgi:hypothetical protein
MRQKLRPVDENQATEHGIEVFLGFWRATSHLISSAAPIRHCRTHSASRQTNKRQSTGSSLLRFRSCYPDLQIPAQFTDLQTLFRREEESQPSRGTTEALEIHPPERAPKDFSGLSPSLLMSF